MQMKKPDSQKYPNDSTRIIDLTCKDLGVYIDGMIEGRINEFAKTLAPLPTNGGDLLTREQAAALLNITLPTLNTWTKTGKLHSCQIPGSRRVYYKADRIYQALRDHPQNVRK
jgi:excisionase family DNA binding protein